jgi:predicted anti-sigma-YlaC factor YlaD
MLRPAFEVEGALSARGDVVEVGVAVEVGMEDVALVLLDEAVDEDIDAGVTVVSACR